MDRPRAAGLLLEMEGVCGRGGGACCELVSLKDFDVLERRVHARACDGQAEEREQKRGSRG